jgi:DNA-binding transcriptional LysR family regulator
MHQPARLHFDLFDLMLFIKVAEARSLTQGAVEANISVAAASMRIKNLERALGAQILNRTKRGVSLTDSGRILETHAREVLQRIDQLYGDLRQFSGEMSGHVRVLSNPTSLEFVPAAIGEFLTAHPAITIDLREGSASDDIARAVHDGATDLGIVLSRTPTDGLETIPYCNDRMVVATARNHPLAAKAPIFFADALDFDFVTLDARTYNHAFIQQWASGLGRTPNIRAQVGNFDVMCRLIESNVGVGLLPGTVARRHAASVAIDVLDLRDDWAPRGSKICVRQFRTLPVAARALIEFLLTHPSTQAAMDANGLALFEKLLRPRDDEKSAAG